MTPSNPNTIPYRAIVRRLFRRGPDDGAPIVVIVAYVLFWVFLAAL